MNAIFGLVVVSLLAVAGLIIAISGWLQPAPSLVRTLQHVQRAGMSDVRQPAERQLGGFSKLAGRLVDVASTDPRLLPTDAQLRLVGRPVEQHVTYLVVAAIAGLVIPTVLITSLQRVGLVSLAWYVPAVAALGCAVLGPLTVHAVTLEQAQEIRTDMRYQVSAYLDVVTMLLAGNTGYEGALEQAARAGDGRLFAELRRRIRDSGTRGASLTEALRRAGVELGLDELEQIAATAALSAAEGAPVARTLAAKCATMRAALSSEQETEARLRTSRLTTPIVGMALIFMALVIYPALSFSS